MTTSPMSEEYKNQESIQNLSQFVQTATTDVLTVVPNELKSSEFWKTMWPKVIKQILEAKEQTDAESKLNLLAVNLTSKANALKTPKDFSEEINFIKDALLEKRTEYQKMVTGTPINLESLSQKKEDIPVVPDNSIIEKKVEEKAHKDAEVARLVIEEKVKKETARLAEEARIKKEEPQEQEGDAIVETIIVANNKGEPSSKDEEIKETKKITLGENEYTVKKINETTGDVTLASVKDPDLVFDVPKTKLETLITNPATNTLVQENAKQILVDLETISEENTPIETEKTVEVQTAHPDLEETTTPETPLEPTTIETFYPTTPHDKKEESLKTPAEKALDLFYKRFQPNTTPGEKKGPGEKSPAISLQQKVIIEKPAEENINEDIPTKPFASTLYDHFSQEDFAELAEKFDLDPEDIDAWREEKMKADEQLIRDHKWTKEQIENLEETPHTKTKLKPGTPIDYFGDREEYEKAKEALFFKRFRENKISIRELLGEEKVQELLAGIKETNASPEEKFDERIKLFNTLKTETGVESFIEKAKQQEISTENLINNGTADEQKKAREIKKSAEAFQTIFADKYSVPSLEKVFQKLLGERKHDPEFAKLFSPEIWSKLLLEAKEKQLELLPGNNEYPHQRKEFLTDLRDEAAEELSKERDALEDVVIPEYRELQKDTLERYEELLDSFAAQAFTYFNVDEKVEREQERIVAKAAKEIERARQEKEQRERAKQRMGGKSINYTSFPMASGTVRLEPKSTLTEAQGALYTLLKSALALKNPDYVADTYIIEDIYDAKDKKGSTSTFMNVVLPNGKGILISKPEIERFLRDNLHVGEHILKIGQLLPEKLTEIVNRIGSKRGYKEKGWTLIDINNADNGQPVMLLKSTTGILYPVFAELVEKMLTEKKPGDRPRPLEINRNEVTGFLEKLDDDDSYFGRKTYLVLREQLVKDPNNSEIRTQLNIIHLAKLIA